MKNYKTLLSLLLAAFCFASYANAQDAPPVPREKAKPQEKKQQSPWDKLRALEKQAKDAESEKMKAEEEKKPEKDSGKKKNEKSDDKKSDKKKKSDDKESDKKKSDDNEAADDADAPARSNQRRGLWSNSRSSKNSKKDKDFVNTFESVVASANESTLSIVSGKRQIALGTVVDSDGLILTKASELRGQLGCKLADGKIVPAKVVGVDPKSDLALLKVEVEEMNVIQWADDLTPPVIGRWVATPKAFDKGKLPTIGVVGVEAREIPASRPFIGIEMRDLAGGNGVRITRVINKSPAEKADLQVNDEIFKMEGELIKNSVELREQIGQFDINDRVSVMIRRGKKELKKNLTLGERDKISPDSTRSNTQNSMGSVLSRRRKDFPTSFQHDSMLGSSTCGGPIVDLSGKAVGINIARAGRVSSLALTAEVVLPILERLKTGDYSPAAVNRVEIESLSADLNELNVDIGGLPRKKQRLELSYHKERAKRLELQSMIRELEKRVEEIEKRESEDRKALKAVEAELDPLLKDKSGLESRLRKLRTGRRY